jgi:hypothetical protein
MSAMPQFKGQHSAEPKRDLSPELTLRLPADLAADAPNIEQTIRTKVYDDVSAVISLSCLMMAGAFVFYAVFGIQ